MNRSEMITKYRDAIADRMTECYRSVLESRGRIQYKLYLWSDGTLQALEQVQGDNGFLVPSNYETMELYYVHTVSAPLFNPWDYCFEVQPDDEAEREQAEALIIDWCMDEYSQNLDDVIDTIIKEYQEEENE